jgi:hypothetical protein
LTFCCPWRQAQLTIQNGSTFPYLISHYADYISQDNVLPIPFVTCPNFNGFSLVFFGLVIQMPKLITVPLHILFHISSLRLALSSTSLETFQTFQKTLMNTYGTFFPFVVIFPNLIP